MRRFFSALIALMLLSVPANADGEVANWNGLYMGAHLGGGFGDSSWGNPLGLVPDHNIDGIIGGLHGGYNFQSGAWVYGIEADFSWSDVDGDSACIMNFAKCKTSLDYLGTVRVRLGYAFDNYLIFATAGYAYTDVDYNISANNGAISMGVGDTTDGYTIGGGAEMKFRSNLSARIEALYYDFDQNDPLEFDQTVIRGGLTWHLQ